jgi:hypothetical protein
MAQSWRLRGSFARSMLSTSLASAMIPDIDIWRCAALMIRHYGDTADIDAAAKADALLAEGDTEGQRACPAADGMTRQRFPRAGASDGFALRLRRDPPDGDGRRARARMKFGFRTPSLKGRLAARISPARSNPGWNRARCHSGEDIVDGPDHRSECL